MPGHQYLYNYYLTLKAEQKTFVSIDSFEIMQRAAKACFLYIKKKFKPKKILVICGVGNNGGDGTLIANYLYKEKILTDIFYPFGLPKTTDAKKAFSLLSNKSIIKKKSFLANMILLLMLY